ncbi:hypothetical protein EDC04DRAFT_2891795 [Pisolithus marmoratus]|nr:hypothetical protein EDC04DRAFT_2891795 [Pisolithus marmoratus]
MAANPIQSFQTAYLIGLAMNIFLYGLVTMQVYLYFTTFKTDESWVKAFIAVLYMVETFSCVVTTYYIYDTLVAHFGDEPDLLRDNWVFAVGTNPFLIFLRPQLNRDFRNYRLCHDGAPLFSVQPSPANNSLQGLVSAAVQHFFAWRAHVLTKSVSIVGAIILCSLASFAGSLATTVNLIVHPVTLGLQVEVTVWLAGAVLADTIIAASLVWHLGRHKTLYPALNSVVNQILRMTVQTGVLTTVAAIIQLTCYLTNSISAYAVFNLMLSKLYTNCMLSTLNARRTRKFEGSSLNDVSHGRSTHPGVVVFPSQRAQPEVFMQVESHHMTNIDDKMSRGMRDEF